MSGRCWGLGQVSQLEAVRTIQQQPSFSPSRGFYKMLPRLTPFEKLVLLSCIYLLTLDSWLLTRHMSLVEVELEPSCICLLPLQFVYLFSFFCVIDDDDLTTWRRCLMFAHCVCYAGAERDQAGQNLNSGRYCGIQSCVMPITLLGSGRTGLANKLACLVHVLKLEGSGSASWQVLDYNYLK